jgi:hypothetical protein
MRVERTVVTVVKTVEAPSAHAARRTGSKRKLQTTVRSAPTFVACDSNISARNATTTCPFAENTFYEYWSSGEALSIRAYSPATRQSYRLKCRGGTTVRCTAGDGAEVRFPASAVWAYTDDQARSYAANADLGPADPTPIDAGSYASPDDEDYSSSDDEGYDPYSSPDDGGYGDQIPNYDSGRGYRVQCADGMYSQSGGIQGACSGHGGVR